MSITEKKRCAPGRTEPPSTAPDRARPDLLVRPHSASSRLRHSLSRRPHTQGVLSTIRAAARQPGAEVPEPRNLYSEHGVLKVDLSIHNYRERDGSVRYCYLLPDGSESPTLRLHPGDLLILHLTNDLTETDPSHATHCAASIAHSHTAHSPAARAADPCTSGAMTPISTNLHFHGLTVPPVCHQDDVLQDLDPAERSALRIPLPHSGERAARTVLVSPAYSRLQQPAGAGRRLRRADHRRHRARQSRKWRACPSACW